VPTWLKLKVRPEQELVVGGWTPGEGNAKDLGAVIVGVYDDGQLRFAGKVGSGFTGLTRKQLRDRLEALETDKPPFDPPPPQIPELRTAHWIKPELVIRAELGGWTREGYVRQTAFKGLELDKDPHTVVRERAITAAEADKAAEAEVAKAEKAAGRRAGRKAASGKPTAKATGTKHDHPWQATADELEALDKLGKEGLWSVGGEELKLTNLDKPLFPPKNDGEPPITKRELIRYFARIAPTMLTHLEERPLNLHRYPNGSEAPGFWQKDIPSTAPKWLRIWHETGFEEREDRAANDHLIADRVATPCWLGNQAAFEIHAWTGRLPEPWAPTFALIDIDPGDKTTWDETVAIARLYRTALEHLGLRAYAKLTGKRGIQAWIPIVQGKYTFEDTSRWVERISRAVGQMVPDLVSWEWSTAKRGGRARLDYTQNQPIKTLVAPYAVRPAPGAPVSAPIAWEELDDAELRPNRWTIRDVVERVEKVGDLFAGAQTDAQDLPPV
jgi:bifunctional non-homologous end joining protein LigD